jgi:lipoate-protein ligase B
LDYGKALDLQRELLAQRKKGLISDTLLLLEHPPVYTCGISSKTTQPPNLPHPAYLVERGGDWTYHGPGQLVGYPIINLSTRNFKVRDYLRFLEDVIIESLESFGLKAETIRGLTGVWCQNKKVASIGIAVKQGIAYHGFSINVSCDLKAFSAIYPCKLEPATISNLEALMKRSVSVKECARAISEVFARKTEGLLAA